MTIHYPAAYSLRGRNSSGRSLDLPGGQAARADLDLHDLAVSNDTSNLEVRLPGTARLVVGVRNIVSVSDALVTDVAAISLDLCH